MIVKMAQAYFRLLELPIELIQHISDYLNIIDQLQLLQTCKYIDEYIYIRYLCNSMDYLSLDEEILEQKKYDKLYSFNLNNFSLYISDLSRFKYLHSISLPDLRHGFYYSSVCFDENILHTIPNLKELNMIWTSDREIIINELNLKKLDLTGCSDFTHEHFKENLESLTLFKRDKKTFDIKKMYKLKELHLYYTNYTNEDIENLVNLKVLTIYDCENVKYLDIKKLPNLEKIYYDKKTKLENIKDLEKFVHLELLELF